MQMILKKTFGLVLLAFLISFTVCCATTIAATSDDIEACRQELDELKAFIIDEFIGAVGPAMWDVDVDAVKKRAARLTTLNWVRGVVIKQSGEIAVAEPSSDFDFKESDKISVTNREIVYNGEKIGTVYFYLLK